MMVSNMIKRKRRGWIRTGLSTLTESEAGSDLSGDFVDERADHLDVVAGHDLYRTMSHQERDYATPVRTIFSSASAVSSGHVRPTVTSAVRRNSWGR